MLAYMYPMPSVSGRLQFGSVDRDPLGGSRVVLTFLTLLKHWQSFEPGSCLLSFSKHLSIYNRTRSYPNPRKVWRRHCGKLFLSKKPILWF